MSFFYSDDPVMDAERHYAEQERKAEKYPVCSHCDEPITDERLFDFNGELYHISCFVSQFQKDTEDYME